MSDIEHIAIERLQAASEMSLANYGLPLVITDSGGKDSSVCKELASRSGIPFEVMHNHTTADAPETVRFVRQEAKRLEDLGIKYTINMPTYKGQRVSMKWCGVRIASTAYGTKKTKCGSALNPQNLTKMPENCSASMNTTTVISSALTEKGKTMTENESAFLGNLADHDRLCEVCRFRFDCHGLSMGPNGPHYPACADGDYETFVDLDALEELMQEEEDNA